MNPSDFQCWNDLEDWLKSNTTEKYSLVGSMYVAFASLDDAMLFQMKYGKSDIQRWMI